MGPQTNGIFGVHFDIGFLGHSGPLDIVHPVHPLATPLGITYLTSKTANKVFSRVKMSVCTTSLVVVLPLFVTGRIGSTVTVI